MFVFACGCGSDDPLERPSGSPPDANETPTPPETITIDDRGIPITLSTHNLYDAEEIEVFYTDAIVIHDELSFEDVLTSCVTKAATNRHDPSIVGLLNGMFKEQGYTKDFLLNPDVERTWSGLDDVTSDVIANTVDNEFLSPLLSNTSSCTDSDGNETTCKRFMCGVDKTPEPVEETGPPEEIDFLIAGQGTITINTKRLYDAEKIEIYYSSEFVVSEASTFRDMLSFCLTFSAKYGHSYDKIGLLNGIGKEEGYTKDFLLNPDVDRTWVYGTDDSDTLETYVDAEFTDPLANNAIDNDRAYKRVMCGAIKGD